MDRLIYLCYKRVRKEYTNFSTKTGLIISLLCLALTLPAIWFAHEIVTNIDNILIPGIVLAIISVAVVLFVSFYEVRFSKETYLDYISFCNKLKSAFQNDGLCVESSFLKDIISRTNEKISVISMKCEKSFANLDKWLQSLIIPLALALFGGIIDHEGFANILINFGVPITIIVIFTYVLWLLIISIINIVSKSQVQKYSEFVDDLQTIIYIEEYALDTQNVNI